MQKKPDILSIPPALRKIQAQVEDGFMKRKRADLENLKVRNAQFFKFQKPENPARITRLAIRLIPQYRKIYYQKIIAASGFFDRVWYLEKYPDIALSKIDPLRHFVVWGNRDKRDPGPYFSTLQYLQYYPDVAKAGMPVLAHYLLYGCNEGRIAQPSDLDTL